MQNYSKLTDYELDALAKPYNLADGHARYTFGSLNETQDRLSHLLSQGQEQELAEAQFFKSFFALSRQHSVQASQRVLYNPSASISIEIVANYLRLHSLSVALIEPVFDNLADIIKRHHIRLEPLHEELLSKYGLEEWLKTIDTDAIFLVIPNNPTGHVFSETDFSTIVDFCVHANKLLILDFSFRFFAPDLLTWDQYALLEQSNVRYIAIEDTGKTWPTFELKVSPLLTDSHTYRSICSIYRDIFICHSPLALAFVESYVQDSYQRGLSETIWSISEGNRTVLRKALTNTVFKVAGQTNTSVEWLSIEHAMSDIELVNRLQTYGLYVLPGRNFFWTHSQENSRFIRIALMRDPQHFARGIERLERFFLSVTT
jgi:aspartate/methionine/tyrosine aminotransferase